MLKLSVRPGEYLMIGEQVKVIFAGGSSNNIHILVDAPKEISIVRSKAAEKAGKAAPSPYYKDAGISEEAKQQIRNILRQEREHAQL